MKITRSRTLTPLLAGALLATIVGQAAHAAIVSAIADNFEGNLSQWNPVGQGVIVVDPLNSANHVLSFTGTAAGGDILSANQVQASATYQLSFDYLGTVGTFRDVGGGFIGTNGPTEAWLYGDSHYPVSVGLFANDGQWHHYSTTLTNAQVGGPLTLKMEDYDQSGPSANNAFFDNVSLSASAPAPGNLALLMAGLATAVGIHWLRRLRPVDATSP